MAGEPGISDVATLSVAGLLFLMFLERGAAFELSQEDIDLFSPEEKPTLNRIAVLSGWSSREDPDAGLIFFTPPRASDAA